MDFIFTKKLKMQIYHTHQKRSLKQIPNALDTYGYKVEPEIEHCRELQFEYLVSLEKKYYKVFKLV